VKATAKMAGGFVLRRRECGWQKVAFDGALVGSVRLEIWVVGQFEILSV
jgi:hypothetical protein